MLELYWVINMILGKDIIQEGSETLYEIAKEISFPLNEENMKTANEIMEYLKNSQDEEISEKYKLRAGVGLAAPQIDKSIRMFGIFLPALEEGDKDLIQIFINPKIISHSEQMCYLSSGEGCLSVDDSITGFVPRYKRISIEAYDIDGNKFEMRLSNLKAIVFQHEFDHLNGIIFTSKVTKDVQHLEAL